MKTKTPMKHITKSISTVLLMTVATSFTVNAALVVYDTIGIDFGTTAPADPDTTFNQVIGVGLVAGASEILSAGTLSNTTGGIVNDVGFTFTNLATSTTVSTLTNGLAGDGALIDHTSVYSDGIRAEFVNGADIFTMTFTGLNDNLAYDLNAGLYNNNGNFISRYEVDGVNQLVRTNNSNPLLSYPRFNDLRTDGSGNLVITGIAAQGAGRAAIAALTLTAVPEPSSTALLGLGLSSLLLRRRRS